MTSHIDAEALAFYAEGLLGEGEEDSVRTHIDGCTRCAATLSELADVSVILGQAPAPPLPTEVADGIDAGVRTEIRERARTGGAPAPGHGGGDAPVVTPLHRRKGRWTPYLVAAAAAVFLVGGGAAVLVGALQDRGPQPGQESIASAPFESEELTEGEPDTAHAYKTDVIDSGTVYTEEELADQAAAVLDRVHGGRADGPGAGSEPLGVSTVPDVDACVARLAASLGVRPTLVDNAAFGSDGASAWVMFAPAEDGAYDVLVVDPACAAGADPERSVQARTQTPAR